MAAPLIVFAYAIVFLLSVIGLALLYFVILPIGIGKEWLREKRARRSEGITKEQWKLYESRRRKIAIIKMPGTRHPGWSKELRAIRDTGVRDNGRPKQPNDIQLYTGEWVPKTDPVMPTQRCAGRKLIVRQLDAARRAQEDS